MAGPHRRQLLSQNKKNLLSQLEADPKMVLRKIRVTFHDPDATDSSEDEGKEVFQKKGLKCVIQEIYIPRNPKPSSTSTTPTSDASSHNSFFSKKKPLKPPQNPKRVLPRTPKSSKYRGVRQRKWGKWAAEIRDPIRNIRVWLGTYQTAEEASMAYQNASIRLQAEKMSLSEKPTTITSSVASTCLSEDSEAPFSHSSPSSVLDISTQGSLVDAQVDNSLRSGAIVDKKSLPLVDVGVDVGEGEVIPPFLQQPLMIPDALELDFGGVEMGFFLQDDWKQGGLDDFAGLKELPLLGLDDLFNDDELNRLDFDIETDDFSW